MSYLYPDVRGGTIGVCENCSAEIDPGTDGFCPVCGWPKSDTGIAAPGQNLEPGEVSCPACWEPNPATNKHCEHCAARLGHDTRVDVSATLAGTSHAGRLWMAGAALLSVVVVVLIGVTVFKDQSREAPVGSEEVSSGEAATPSTVADQSLSAFADVPSGPLVAMSVEASSEHSSNVGAANLLDGDFDSAWSDASQGGDGAVLTFRFERPVLLETMTIRNLADEVRFLRNFRVRAYRIEFDSPDDTVGGELLDTQDPQNIRLADVVTSRVVFQVMSTFAAEAVGEQAPFADLAVAEVAFTGR